ncbi:ATP-binding protein [Actinomadura viridis]|uniref:ATP-binding protein n=1 Tax=Actinomadura viridis TaxID=58110 RepID=UPI00367E8C03
MTPPAPPPSPATEQAPRRAVPILAACAAVAVIAAPLSAYQGEMGAPAWALAIVADLLAVATAAVAWWLSGRHRAALEAVAHYRSQAEQQAAALHALRQEQMGREQMWQAHAGDLAARNETTAAMVEHLLRTQLPAAWEGRTVPSLEREEALDPRLAKMRDEVLDAAAGLWRDREDVLESQQLTLVALARRVQSAMHRVQAEAATTAERYRDLPELYVTCQVIDHLAAQAARLAQGLAVACGTWEGQQWDSPMRLAEVVQAAQARIEDYRRVSVEGDPDTAIAPAALESVIHVLAELLANATESSPTETVVSVRVSGAAQGAVFRIDDHGAGLEEPRMSQARALLDGTRRVSLAEMGEVPRMGFPVVARYVQRHGLKVTLDESPYGGLQAIVLVPKDLVTIAESAPEPASLPSTGFERTSLAPPAPPAPASAPPPAPVPSPAAEPPAPPPGTPPATEDDGLVLPQRISRRNRGVPPPAAPPMIAPSPETPEEAGEMMGALFRGAGLAHPGQDHAAPAEPAGAAGPDADPGGPDSPDHDDDAYRTGEGR